MITIKGFATRELKQGEPVTARDVDFGLVVQKQTFEETLQRALLAEKKLDLAVKALQWVKDQCGYASPWWIKMDEALKQIREVRNDT